jgi:hypothetical protein
MYTQIDHRPSHVISRNDNVPRIALLYDFCPRMVETSVSLSGDAVVSVYFAVKTLGQRMNINVLRG